MIRNLPENQGSSLKFFHASRIIVILSAVALFVACGGRQVSKHSVKRGKGFYYTVKPGETLWQIALSNKVNAQQIAEWNNIQDPNKVSAGMRIYVPKTRTGGSRTGKFDAPLSFDRDRFRWPVNGPVVSGFGMRNGNRHDGVDIKAKTGTPIHAAADGEVVYVGSLRGYGNLIILRHADRYYTTYAHNSRNLTSVGKHVKAGEVIGLVGATGRATGPHLHFEARLGATARNPLFFMPAENNANFNVASNAKQSFKHFTARPEKKSNNKNMDKRHYSKR